MATSSNVEEDEGHFPTCESNNNTDFPWGQTIGGHLNF